MSGLGAPATGSRQLERVKTLLGAPAKPHAPLCFGVCVAVPGLALRRLSLVSGKRGEIDCRLATVPGPLRWVTYSRTSDPTCTRDCMHPTTTGVAGPAEVRRGPGARPSTHDVLCANNGAHDRGLALLALIRSKCPRSRTPHPNATLAPKVTHSLPQRDAGAQCGAQPRLN
jgi:hypothetical protein